MAHMRPLWHITKDLLSGHIDPFINALQIQCIPLCCNLTYIYYLVHKIFGILCLSCMKKKRTQCANKELS